MGPLLDRADEVIAALGTMVPSVLPIVRWYQAEKSRIHAGTQQEVAARTLEIHEKLQRILSVYMLEDSIKAHESHYKD